MNASEFGCGAGHQFAITAAKAGWELEDFSTLTRSEKKCRQVLQFLRGEAELVVKVKAAPAPEPVIDPIIRVDRTVKPSYPDWVEEVLHPDLEASGPSEYDIANIEQWLYDGQKGWKRIEGNKIYAHLKGTPDTSGDLKNHLGIRDLEEIRKKGIAFFREHFKGKAVFGWKGVVRNYHGNLYVPYLYENGVWVVQDWSCLGRGLCDSEPALRHASGT